MRRDGDRRHNDRLLDEADKATPRRDWATARERATDVFRVDSVKRRDMLWEVQRIHLTEFPRMPVLWSANTCGRRPEVKGHIIPLLSATSAHGLEAPSLEG